LAHKHGLAIRIGACLFPYSARPFSEAMLTPLLQGHSMLISASVNRVTGLYRSDCCGVELTILAFQRFPPCSGGSRFRCRGQETNWVLVRRILTDETRAASPLHGWTYDVTPRTNGRNSQSAQHTVRRRIDTYVIEGDGSGGYHVRAVSPNGSNYIAGCFLDPLKAQDWIEDRASRQPQPNSRLGRIPSGAGS
jgi:hypothetical protein